MKSWIKEPESGTLKYVLIKFKKDKKENSEEKFKGGTDETAHLR